MAYSEDWQLTVDGVPFVGEYTGIDANTPCAVHDIPDDGEWVSRVLGPASFTVLIANPSDQLYALVDGGHVVRDVKLTANGYSISHPTHFYKGWISADGVRKMFGSLAVDREREAKWVEELPATVSTAQIEGN
ncbi:hypothetical protein [Streptomyces sp. 1222.5]|uniref:hypothetical protein n=1 Tax=Streptomyces sp. 1222.5 TaxID=1881026 RepID=UPI003EB8C651